MERSHLTIGIVPLADCAPVVIAKERGFFTEQGLEVQIRREPSWANIRDKVAVGALDGAQMLATMPMSMTLGLAGVTQKVVTGLALSQEGNTITVSSELFRRMADFHMAPNRALKKVIDEDHARGKDRMTFAMTYPFSTHHYELRYWMAAGGIDPDRDVRLVVVPPPQVVAHLSAGNIAGFCVGEPWGSVAQGVGLGRIVATSRDVYAGRIEKVFGVTRDFADTCPETHKATVKALISAARWCQDNPGETAEIIARPEYLNVPVEMTTTVLSGPMAPIFHGGAVNFPWRSQAQWYLGQMCRWGHSSSATDDKAMADECYRPDIYRVAALELGIPVPLVDRKLEGSHSEEWVLDNATDPIAVGPDCLLDGLVFDPFQPRKPTQISLQENQP